jgi:hypothetical protein
MSDVMMSDLRLIPLQDFYRRYDAGPKRFALAINLCIADFLISPLQGLL